MPLIEYRDEGVTTAKLLLTMIHLSRWRVTRRRLILHEISSSAESPKKIQIRAK